MPAKLWGSHYNIGRDIVVFERESKKQLYLVDSLVDDHTYHFTPLEEKVVDGKIVLRRSPDGKSFIGYRSGDVVHTMRAWEHGMLERHEGLSVDKFTPLEYEPAS